MKKVSSSRAVHWLIIATLTLGSGFNVHAEETKETTQKKAHLKKLVAEWKATRTLAKKVKAGQATPAEKKELKKRRRRIIRRAILGAIIVAFLVAIGVFIAKGKSDKNITTEGGALAAAETTDEAVTTPPTPAQGEVATGPEQACSKELEKEFYSAINARRGRDITAVFNQCSPSKETMLDAFLYAIQYANLSIVELLLNKSPQAYGLTTPDTVLFGYGVPTDHTQTLRRMGIIKKMVENGAESKMGDILFQAIGHTAIPRDILEKVIVPGLISIMNEKGERPDDRTINLVKEKKELPETMFNNPIYKAFKREGWITD
jgi:hypothetical protein